MSHNTVIALALLAGTAATVVRLVRVQRTLKRLEDEARRELEAEPKRSEWNERKKRKFGGYRG